ncbi:DUF3408 domain-containing protein [uncultured Polaribacter sp.]|uniref:DUF3408 domain-containing protein n=1 Tax=uncultured Polaribacter sp. TaxID=174711 RepID=UPI002623ADA4|nr:DUF3408 domain-containing protein [uncultured Polaribacter sp.]
MKKKEAPINEDKLMEMMSHSFSEDRALPEMRETAPKKKNLKSKEKLAISLVAKKQTSFQELFLQKSDLTARNGKSISIRKEFHQRLLRITQVIGDNQIPISGYLDKILEHHFREFETDIKKQFKDKYKPIL